MKIKYLQKHIQLSTKQKQPLFFFMQIMKNLLSTNLPSVTGPAATLTHGTWQCRPLLSALRFNQQKCVTEGDFGFLKSRYEY